MIAEYSLHTISKILDGMACGPILNFHGIIIAEIRVVINMNKIIGYFTGVFCMLNASACWAVDKFDVLPDLPDPLAYAVQPAAASTVSGTGNTSSILGGAQSVGGEPNIISVVLSLAFVVLLIYLTGILYAKLNRVGFNTLKRQQGDFAKSHVSVISTTQLGNNKTLHVVELDGKRMLIGASQGAIQLIKDLGSSEEGDFDGEYSKIEIPNIKIPKIEIPKIEIPSIGFSKMVTKSHKKLEEEMQNEPDETSFTEEVNMEEERPEDVIDSLFTQQNSVPEEPEDKTSNEHMVNPDDFALYKKYL